MNFHLFIPRRILCILISFSIGFSLFAFAAWPPTVRLPSEPFEVGAGPCPPNQIERTQIVISVPDNFIKIIVFFNSCKSQEYHIWALLPFTARNVTASVESSLTGTVAIKPTFENLLEYGACIANASFRHSNYKWLHELRISLVFELQSDLEAVRYGPDWNPLASTQGVILTFLVQEAILATQKNCQLTKV